MSTFECKVSELPTKEDKTIQIPSNQVSNNKVSNNKVSNNEESNKKVKFENDDGSNSKTLFEMLDNINNIRAFIITLLVYLIIHSEIFINILINTLEFLNSSGKINVLGNIALFSTVMFTFIYLS